MRHQISSLVRGFLHTIFYTIAYGVWISLWSNLVSTSYKIIRLRHDIEKIHTINNTTRHNFLNKSANISSDLAKTSLEIIDPAIWFLIAGTISATLAIFLGIMGYWKIRDS